MGFLLMVEDGLKWVLCCSFVVLGRGGRMGGVLRGRWMEGGVLLCYEKGGG